jgi:hypothetical protein
MSAEHEDQEDLVSVREVPDEATATLLCDFLKTQGIEATAVPVQIPWLGPIETLHHGFWGRVEVLEDDAERARALIQEYMSATPEPEPDEEGP